MIVVDYNQTGIANFMAEIGSRPGIAPNIDLVRHMIANSLRGYRQKFGEKYGELVVACDSRTYWRKEVFPLYKAGRKKSREESGFDWKAIFEALGTIRDEIDKFFPYKVINVEGAEADDVIAILAEWSQTNNLDCSSPFSFSEPKPFMIISGDHDFIQLQRYKNVKQYSPTKKAMVTSSTTPEKYVLEHTIRGDKGDGIPNAFSADDSFVTGERQKPISTKRLNEWLDDPTLLPNDEEFVSRFRRNKKLIDFNQIPSNIKTAIINNFIEQPSKDRSKLFNYFVHNKMKNMLDVLEEF